jgi:hypothetical protein
MSEGYAPPPHGAPQFRAPGQPAQPYGYGTPGQPVPVAVVPPAPWSAPQAAVPAGPPQRPAVIALGCTLAVMAALQWICALSLVWVTATVGTGAFSEVNDNGVVFHVLDRISQRLLDGLAVPLYLFPLASITTGFLILSRRRWTLVAHTAVGLAALAWAAWWLQDNLLWWFSAAWYVVVACLVLWTPGATAWYRWRPDDRAPYPAG